MTVKLTYIGPADLLFAKLAMMKRVPANADNLEAAADTLRDWHKQQIAKAAEQDEQPK